MTSYLTSLLMDNKVLASIIYNCFAGSWCFCLEVIVFQNLKLLSFLFRGDGLFQWLEIEYVSHTPTEAKTTEDNSDSSIGIISPTPQLAKTKKKANQVQLQPQEKQPDEQAKPMAEKTVEM